MKGDTWETKPELKRLYPTAEMRPEWLRFVLTAPFHQIPIPTEIVASEPAFIVPMMGRAWLNIGLYIWNGAVRTYEEVRELSGRVVSTGDMDGGVYCVEVYADEGDDGHTMYGLIGYRFIKSGWAGPGLEHLSFKDEKSFGPLGRPVPSSRRRPDGAMFENWDDDDYDRRTR